MLRAEDTLLLVIDVQEKLFRVMPDKEILLANLKKLILGCRLMGVPIILTEQNPNGLGITVPEIGSVVPEAQKAVKFTFSCCSDKDFYQQLEAFNRRQVILCGIESHICVYQTAVELLSVGYGVQVVSDGISSRSLKNKELALERLQSEGVKLTGVEMALFELLRTAKSEQFKAISALIK